jgi:hypothetical protein
MTKLQCHDDPILEVQLRVAPNSPEWAGLVHCQDVLEFLDEDSGWAKIKSPSGKIGFIPKRLLLVDSHASSAPPSIKLSDIQWRKVISVKASKQTAALVTLKALHIQYDQAVGTNTQGKLTPRPPVPQESSLYDDTLTADAKLLSSGVWKHKYTGLNNLEFEDTLRFGDFEESALKAVFVSVQRTRANYLSTYITTYTMTLHYASGQESGFTSTSWECKNSFLPPIDKKNYSTIDREYDLNKHQGPCGTGTAGFHIEVIGGNRLEAKIGWKEGPAPGEFSRSIQE